MFVNVSNKVSFYRMHYTTKFQQYLKTRMLRLQTTGLEGNNLDRFLQRQPEWRGSDIWTLGSSLRSLKLASSSLGFGQFLEGDKAKHMRAIQTHLVLAQSLGVAFLQGGLPRSWDGFDDRQLMRNLARSVTRLCYSAMDLPKFIFYTELFMNIGVLDVEDVSGLMLEMNARLKPGAGNGDILLDLFRKLSHVSDLCPALRPVTMSASDE